MSSNNQSLLFHSEGTRNQSIEAAIASISNLMDNITKEEEETNIQIGVEHRMRNKEDCGEEMARRENDYNQFFLPSSTIMTRQDTFGEGTQSSIKANVPSIESSNLLSPTISGPKSNDTFLNDTYYSLERNPSFDYETNVFVKEARVVSMKKSPTNSMSPTIDPLRKSFSCGNFSSNGKGTTAPIRIDSLQDNMTHIPILNFARHTRNSSFSISSPETNLTSYFSDTEDMETPESPIFQSNEEEFSSTPTLRQIRTKFLDQGPSDRESGIKMIKIKPLTLSLPPKTKSEAIKKILEDKEYKNTVHHSLGDTAMRYQHSEPISEAERLIKSYFTDTNLIRQHLYNEYNNTILNQQKAQPEPEIQQVKSDPELLLDISTGGWGGRYSTGEKVPPLLYHESSEEYFREQLQNMKVDDGVDQESIKTIISDLKTPTSHVVPMPKSPEDVQVNQSENTKNEGSHATIKEQDKSSQGYNETVQKSEKPSPPPIPPKSTRRPKMMIKSISHSLDCEREPKVENNFTNQHKYLPYKPENFVKQRDFFNEREPESNTDILTSKPRILRSSRSENALDGCYNSGEAYMNKKHPLLEDERATLTLSRLGFYSNKNGIKRGKLHILYRYNQTELGESDEDLGFSTNITPSSNRSSLLIRSVAALKSLSKRITSRKSQLFDISQKIQYNKEIRGNGGTTRINSPISPTVSHRNLFDHKATKSDPLINTFSSHPIDAEMPKSRSLSPFQQVYARAWPIKKAPKSFIVAANKTQNYF